MDQGLSQKEIAEAAGVTNAAISKWESNGGEAISAIAALRVSTQLNVNPYWLILGVGQPTDKIEVPDISKTAQEIARKIDNLPGPLSDAIQALLRAVHA
jgi:transcriptional regulator with XRE-family HTH domain